MKAIITMPNYDDATSYLYCYSEDIIKFAEKNGIQISVLKRPKLKRDNFENIANQNIKLLLFNAHGDEETIYGDKVDGETEYLVKKDYNHSLLESKLTYARACSAAASLGKTVSSGCFIGYNQPFSFWIDNTRSSTPLKDKTAQLFLEPSNELMISLLRGKSGRDSVSTFNNFSKKNILRLLGKKGEPGALASISLLWNNMVALEIHGNEEMKL